MQYVTLEMTNKEFSQLSPIEMKILETYRKVLETKEDICLVLQVNE